VLIPEHDNADEREPGRQAAGDEDGRRPMLLIMERAQPDEEHDRSAKRDRGIGSNTFEPKGKPVLGRFYVVVWDARVGAHSLP
jgi:hypothetical protein